MISPNSIIPIFLVGLAVGALGYSYSIGLSQGESICNEERLQSQLNKTKIELKQQEELAQMQQESLGEAQSQIEDLELRSKILGDSLVKAVLSNKSQCIPDSVLDELRKFRRDSQGKNS